MRTQGPTNKMTVLEPSLPSPLPLPRGEDEGEGFKIVHRASILILPLSLGKGEATRQARRHSQM